MGQSPDKGGFNKQRKSCNKQPGSHLLASLLSPRDLSSLKQHMTATGTIMRDRPTSSTILQSGTCNSQSHISPPARAEPEVHGSSLSTNSANAIIPIKLTFGQNKIPWMLYSPSTDLQGQET